VTVTDRFHCSSCGPVAVDIHFRDGMSLVEVGCSLSSISFASQVTHDLLVHLDEVGV